MLTIKSVSGAVSGYDARSYELIVRVFNGLTRDDILDNITTWLTDTALSGVRLYWENWGKVGYFNAKGVTIPVAVNVFPDGTNPEQLFAAGWSASFADAIALAASKREIELPGKIGIDAEVDLNLGEGGYFLSARLNVRLPGLERSIAKDLVEAAGEICPYSRGNIQVTVKLI
jgi:Ohr subfamily peroxiredoxin